MSNKIIEIMINDTKKCAYVFCTVADCALRVEKQKSGNRNNIFLEGDYDSVKTAIKNYEDAFINKAELNVDLVAYFEVLKDITDKCIANKDKAK